MMRLVGVMFMVLLHLIVLSILTGSPQDATNGFPQIHTQDIAGGVPIQRRRIDMFIAQTARYDSIEALFDGLHDPVESDFDIVFDAGLPVYGPLNIYQCLLADRRVARLYELIAKLPAEDAAALVEERFVSKLAIHLAAWDKAIRSRLDGDPVPVPITGNFHAMIGAVFLCSRFCDEKKLAELVSSWRAEMAKRKQVIDANPRIQIMLTEYDRSGVADPLFFTNLYIGNMSSRHVFDESLVNRRLREAGLPEHEFVHVPLVAWDADTNPFDFTHQHRGVPVDTRNVRIDDVVYVCTAPDWVIHDEELSRQVEDIFRRVCLAGSAARK